MTSHHRPSERPVPTCSRVGTASREEEHGLPSDSYTVERLEHSSPSHLHATSRRFFIGPLPRGWVHSHRKPWLKSFFGLTSYSSRAASFSAMDPSLGRHTRQEEGLADPDFAAAYRQSFPQPEDVDFDEEEADEGAGEDMTTAERSQGGPDVATTTTRAHPLDTTQEPQTRAQGEPGPNAKPPGETYPRDRQGEPGHPQKKGAKAKRVSFPEGSFVSLRQSSSMDMQETFYTPPESKSQADGIPKSILASAPPKAPEDPPAGRSSAKGTSLRSPTVTMVPESPESDEGPSRTISESTPLSPTEFGSQASLIPHRTTETTQPTEVETEEEGETTQASPREPLQQEEPCAVDEEVEREGRREGQRGQETGEVQHQEEAVRTPTPPEVADRKSLDHRILTRFSSLRSGMGDNLIERRHRLSKRFSRGQDASDPVAQRERQLSECRGAPTIRAERMLVKLDVTEQSVPDEYSENESLKIESRPIEKWREYLVVCRQASGTSGTSGAGSPALLQLFKTRVITPVLAPQVKKRPSHEILLVHGTTHANLFSGLDKTIAIWHPYKQQQTRIVILRAASAAHSVEWYTFIRDTLGRKVPSTLMVHVPDMGVSLRLKNPFVLLAAIRQQHLQQQHQEHQQQNENESITDDRIVCREQGVAPAIVNTCINTLRQCAQFSTVLDVWTKSEKMGLAWRRYDRLEWVQGANEQRMYGMQSMYNSHELELRPRQHYPTATESVGPGPMDEPPPVEGFMILLTSQRGQHRRWGKNFFKRLYFYTQDQYLCFCRPARATPPAPPRIASISGSRVPRTSEIVKESPLIYTVDPFPLQDGEISWLTVGRRRAYVRRHDAEAYAESRRNVANLKQAEGYINLCRITNVRPVVPSTSPNSTVVDGNTRNNNNNNEDANGGNAEFHGEASRRGSSSSHHQSKGSRTLELELDDGLVVRLRAYSQETRDEWIKRLRQMIIYWKARTRDDTMKLRGVRQRNLDRLEIDEQQESMLGQLGQKWEVSKAEASPELFHTCGISGCRAIKMSGQLYRKTRRRAPFVKTSVILMEGRLLVFQGTVRNSSGAQLPHTHHDRQSVLDLCNCYVYSGIITCSEQLYQTQKTIDNQMPGHYSIPRIYLSDGWTSTDEDTATCFVIWRGTRKSLFGGEESQQPGGGMVKTKCRQVRALGVPGKSIMFKTRSRAERDLWVLAIQTEIDRMQQEEDLRAASNPKT